MTEPECGDVFAKLSEYLDGELPEDLCEQMKQHIGGCGPCVEFVESLRKSIDVVRSGVEEEGPAPLPEDCREALLAAYLRARTNSAC